MTRINKPTARSFEFLITLLVFYENCVNILKLNSFFRKVSLMVKSGKNWKKFVYFYRKMWPIN